jgi:hypothetical protein
MRRGSSNNATVINETGGMVSITQSAEVLSFEFCKGINVGYLV